MANGDADEAAAKPAAEAGRREPAGPQSEWTASDSRGPLNAADRDGGEAEPIAEPVAATDTTPPPAEETAPAPAQAAASSETPSAAPSTAAAPERRNVPVVPIVVALIVGAVIGAGSAALMYAYGGGSNDTGQVSALASRVDALEKRPDPQPEIDALKGQVAAAPKPQAFDPAPLQDKIAGLQSDVDALKQKKGADPALDQKLAAQGDDVKGLDGKVAALAGSIDALKAQGDALKAQGDGVKDLDGKVAALATAIDGLKKQDEAQQGGLAAVQSGQKALEGKVSTPALAVVADSLVEAIRQGKPYTSQVVALASLAADPAKLAVLRENADKGVPSAQVLAQKFAPLADPIMATAYKAQPNAGLMDKLKSGMMSMVSVRNADSTTGDDLGSRVSRIEADLAHEDVAGAYETWDGLPAAAKAKSEAWGALAKTHVEAMSAARGLQAQAIAALGAKKS